MFRRAWCGVQSRAYREHRAVVNCFRSGNSQTRTFSRRSDRGRCRLVPPEAWRLCTMSEQLAGVVEGQASEGDISSRQHTLTLRFAKLGLTALTATLLLGVGAAHAICPCGDEVCGGPACTPPETAQTCPADCGSVRPITPQPSRPGDIIDCTRSSGMKSVLRLIGWLTTGLPSKRRLKTFEVGQSISRTACKTDFAKNGKVVCEQSVAACVMALMLGLRSLIERPISAPAGSIQLLKTAVWKIDKDAILRN